MRNAKLLRILHFLILFFVRSAYGLALGEGQGRSALCNPHFWTTAI